MLPGEARAAASSFSLEISTTRRQRALAALDLDAIQAAVIKSFADGSPPVTVTAEQMTLEDLGSSKVGVTIVQATGGPTAEDITAAAEQPTVRPSMGEELGEVVEFDVPPATVPAVGAPPPSASPPTCPAGCVPRLSFTRPAPAGRRPLFASLSECPDGCVPERRA